MRTNAAQSIAARSSAAARILNLSLRNFIMGPLNAASEANAYLAAARNYVHYFVPFKFGPNFS